jgi:hypothetical protein
MILCQQWFFVHLAGQAVHFMADIIQDTGRVKNLVTTHGIETVVIQDLEGHSIIYELKPTLASGVCSIYFGEIQKVDIDYLQLNGVLTVKYISFTKFL